MDQADSRSAAIAGRRATCTDGAPIATGCGEVVSTCFRPRGAVSHVVVAASVLGWARPIRNALTRRPNVRTIGPAELARTTMTQARWSVQDAEISFSTVVRAVRDVEL